MKHECDLIKDILPLYHDEVASEASKKAVKEHLLTCEDCKNYYEKLCNSDIVESTAFDQELARQTAESFKKVSKKIIKMIMKAVVCIALVAIGIAVGLYALLVFYIKDTASESWETHYDINEYGMLDSGKNLLESSGYLGKIWPKEITEDMDVKEYLLIHYNPWDTNYLGYLEVEYDMNGYEAEIARLSEYPSTEYLGDYGAGEFEKYELLAMYNTSYCFIYALTDGEGRVMYVYLYFPGYSMDIEYEDYIPKDCLPKGIDLSEDNPVRQEVLKEREKDLERYKEQQKGK